MLRTGNARVKLGFCCNNGIRGLSVFLSPLRFLPLLYSTSTSTSTSTSLVDYGGKVKSSPLSDFLVNSLGFRDNQSVSVSAKLEKLRIMGGTKKVSDFTFIDNAHFVVDFFQKLGFNQSQIKNLVSKEPRILLSNVENSLKPKIKVLKDLGISDCELIGIISTNYEVLRSNLGPVIHAFRTVMGSDDNVVLCLKRRTFFGGAGNLVPNVELLQNSFGVSIDIIRKSILRSPRALLVRTDLLAEVLAEVDELGIPRDSAMFMYGLQLLINHKGKGLENKYAIFKSFGWTQSDIKAFVRRNPFCLSSSEAVIKRKLDFLMNHIGYTPDYLVTRISFFTYSVEKRLLPRHRVLQILREKGKTKIALYSVTNLTESAFFQRFVLPFEEVHEVYAQLIGSKRGSLNLGRAKGKS